MGLFGRERIEGKTPDQIVKMRTAGLLVGETLELVREHVTSGVTTRELDAIADANIRRHGGVPSFLGYHGFTGTLCTSVNDEIVHGIPGNRVLQEGDLISIDCGAIVPTPTVKAASPCQPSTIAPQSIEMRSPSSRR